MGGGKFLVICMLQLRLCWLLIQVLLFMFCRYNLAVYKNKNKKCAILLMLQGRLILVPKFIYVVNDPSLLNCYLINSFFLHDAISRHGA